MSRSKRSYQYYIYHLSFHDDGCSFMHIFGRHELHDWTKTLSLGLGRAKTLALGQHEIGTFVGALTASSDIVRDCVTFCFPFDFCLRCCAHSVRSTPKRRNGAQLEVSPDIIYTIILVVLRFTNDRVNLDQFTESNLVI